MSEFSDAFGTVFDASYAVFGDICTIANEQYQCVIHGFNLADVIRPGSAGRSQDISGSVVITADAWEDAKTRLIALGIKIKGARVILPGGTFRIVNDPDQGFTSSIVELQLGPLTQ